MNQAARERVVAGHRRHSHREADGLEHLAELQLRADRARWDERRRERLRFFVLFSFAISQLTLYSGRAWPPVRITSWNRPPELS